MEAFTDKAHLTEVGGRDAMMMGVMGTAFLGGRGSFQHGVFDELLLFYRWYACRGGYRQ